MNELAQYEFEDEAGRSLGDYIHILRRRKKSIAVTFLSIMLLALLAALLWPPTYKSESIVLIEQQEIPAELVQTTITSYAQQRIEQIKARIMTIGNIMSIVDEYQLYTEKERQRKTRTDIATAFRDSVAIQPISAEVVDPRSGRPSSAVIAFSLSFKADSPSAAQKVTNEITQLYLDQNRKDRREESANTSKFLEKEAEEFKKSLAALDKKIANFKEESADALPSQLIYNRGVVDRSITQIDSLVYQLSEFKKRKIALESELAQLNPNAPVILATGQAVLGGSDRLKALQTQLRQDSAKYSDNHPTIMRLKREIAELVDSNVSYAAREEALGQLRLEKDRLVGLKQRYTAQHPKILESQEIIRALELEINSDNRLVDEEKPDNPAYLVVQGRLDSTEEEIRVANQQIGELRAKRDKHELLISQTPQVESELQEMNRDYQNMSLKYQEISAKQMAAELARNLESEERGERFTLIQPPELPIDPVSPNRVAIIVLGFVMALGAGVGMALLKDILDGAVYGRTAVMEATGAMPLVSIAYMENTTERKKHFRSRVLWVLLLLSCCLIALLSFHYFIKPLDVTWFILMRKFGL